mmetsp:Transcript_15068/g.21974  ORF Transcript_15068/g.21974 Transcript_15068/m.21974 type:complete len:83 (-) Transcript_15068:759-1007(-)
MVLIEKINQDDMGFTISLVLNCRKITPDVTEPPRFAKMTSPLSDLFGLEIKIDKWYTEHYLVERNCMKRYFYMLPLHVTSNG